MNIRGDVKNGHIRFIIQVESFSLQSQYHKVKKVNLFYGTLRNGARMMDYMSEKHLKVSGLLYDYRICLCCEKSKPDPNASYESMRQKLESSAKTPEREIGFITVK